jgi:hypothetical protein
MSSSLVARRGEEVTGTQTMGTTEGSTVSSGLARNTMILPLGAAIFALIFAADSSLAAETTRETVEARAAGENGFA